VLHTDIPLTLIPQAMFGRTDSTVLQAVPFFSAGGGRSWTRGDLAPAGPISANTLVGWVTGRLAMVSVVASMFFAGISGSAAADSAAIGSGDDPAMERKGYASGFRRRP